MPPAFYHQSRSDGTIAQFIGWGQLVRSLFRSRSSRETRSLRLTLSMSTSTLRRDDGGRLSTGPVTWRDHGEGWHDCPASFSTVCVGVLGKSVRVHACVYVHVCAPPSLRVSLVHAHARRSPFCGRPFGRLFSRFEVRGFFLGNETAFPTKNQICLVVVAESAHGQIRNRSVTKNPKPEPN